MFFPLFVLYRVRIERVCLNVGGVAQQAVRESKSPTAVLVSDLGA